MHEVVLVMGSGGSGMAAVSLLLERSGVFQMTGKFEECQVGARVACPVTAETCRYTLVHLGCALLHPGCAVLHPGCALLHPGRTPLQRLHT
eukprot:103268-Pyramimonas_sp.AAC.1